jgi:hypothetical protein
MKKLTLKLFAIFCFAVLTGVFGAIAQQQGVKLVITKGTQVSTDQRILLIEVEIFNMQGVKIPGNSITVATNLNPQASWTDRGSNLIDGQLGWNLNNAYGSANAITPANPGTVQFTWVGDEAATIRIHHLSNNEGDNFNHYKTKESSIQKLTPGSSLKVAANWVTKVSVTNNINPLTEHQLVQNIPAQQGVKIRINRLGMLDEWARISEIEVYDINGVKIQNLTGFAENTFVATTTGNRIPSFGLVDNDYSKNSAACCTATQPGFAYVRWIGQPAAKVRVFFVSSHISATLNTYIPRSYEIFKLTEGTDFGVSTNWVSTAVYENKDIATVTQQLINPIPNQKGIMLSIENGNKTGTDNFWRINEIELYDKNGQILNNVVPACNTKPYGAAVGWGDIDNLINRNLTWTVAGACSFLAPGNVWLTWVGEDVARIKIHFAGAMCAKSFSIKTLNIGGNQNVEADWTILKNYPNNEEPIVELNLAGDLFYDSNSNSAYILGAKVGIGTKSPLSDFSVNGTITAKTFITTQIGWSDFVFDKNYELKPLEQVESFIKENGHLPNVPSADEILKNGNTLGETDAILLQKIEELTLYLINLEKKNKEITKEIDELKSKK